MTSFDYLLASTAAALMSDIYEDHKDEDGETFRLFPTQGCLTNMPQALVLVLR